MPTSFGLVLTLKEHKAKKYYPTCHSQEVRQVIEPFIPKAESKTRPWCVSPCVR